MPDTYFCEITERAQLTDSIFSITIECPELAVSARAGQFLHIKCGETVFLRRPISICSVKGGTLRFVYEVKGEGTRWLSMRSIGEALDILGPLGNGYTLPEGKTIIVGGGIGVPPLLFAAESAGGDVTAVLGFREKSLVILQNEFESVCNEVHVATDDGSSGVYGNAAMVLEGLLEKGKCEYVLACGRLAMLAAVASICERYNVPCQVSMEERMGCGVGACMVCSCPTVIDGAESMSRVCRDGPVFDARTIRFD